MAEWGNANPINITPGGDTILDGFIKTQDNFNDIYAKLNIVKRLQASSTEPNNPTVNEFWFDTTQKILKRFNGSEWEKAIQMKPDFDSGWFQPPKYQLTQINVVHNLNTANYIVKLYVKVLAGTGSSHNAYQTGDVVEIAFNDVHHQYTIVGMHVISRTNDLVVFSHTYVGSAGQNDTSGHIEFADLRIKIWKT